MWEGAHLGVGVEVVAHVPQACGVRTRERASERGVVGSWVHSMGRSLVREIGGRHLQPSTHTYVN